MENNESWKHEGKSWYLLRYGQISFQKMHSQLENSGLEFFLPSYTAVENRKQGVQVRVERALMFNMMFIHSSLDECVQFVVNNPGVNFMAEHKNKTLAGLMTHHSGKADGYVHQDRDKS